ncbi:hypothetical protein ASPBRDRAFT_37915 [Aspergillus brasiliensis CBS 101740]|uniref:Uncharacterized protein n=1 Tax=Aspergillus brasiliensis (strain CBS 101740 / IMI 381727 / IBT 21946) TaxID=767769 RepID=A0A1L9UVC0_ASPBC|nr:hypothetical protein ASPBRDRAFT_37915 [Aspergillus brasiliensis CBS 101740]
MAPHERKSDETQSGLDAWDWRAVNKEGGEHTHLPLPSPSSHARRMGWKWWTIDSRLALVRD